MMPLVQKDDLKIPDARIILRKQAMSEEVNHNYLEEDEGVTFEIVTVTRITVPSGSTIEKNTIGGGGAIILPTGESLKSYVVFEKNEEKDLNSLEMEELGCYNEDISREITRVK